MDIYSVTIVVMMFVVELESDSNFSKPFIPSPPLSSAAMVTPTTTTSIDGNGVGGNVGAGGQRQGVAALPRFPGAGETPWKRTFIQKPHCK